MDQPVDTRPTPKKKSKSDRWIKLLFAAAAIAIAVFIWGKSRKLPLKGWDDDLEAAMQKAQAEARPVVIFFMSTPPGFNDRRVMGIIKKPQNRKALEDGNFVKVKAQEPTHLKSDTARRFKLKQLPTLILLGPDGKESNRREGIVGELDFRKGFLDLKRIERP